MILTRNPRTSALMKITKLRSTLIIASTCYRATGGVWWRYTQKTRVYQLQISGNNAVTISSVQFRVTEPSNIRWFEKLDIRSLNIELSKHSRIFDHRTGSIIEGFNRSTISIFYQGFDIRYSMVQRIEYLKNLKRLDFR